MSERDDRLRELLRDADPAQEATELGDGEAAWLRQRLLRAADEPPARQRATRVWVLAGAATLLAIAIGLVLTRTNLPVTPAAPQGASVQAVTEPGEGPARDRTGGDQVVATHAPPAETAVASAPPTRNSVDEQAATRSSRAEAVVPSPPSLPPRTANDAAPAAALAARGEEIADVSASRVPRRATNPARRRLRTSTDTAEVAPRETVIAQAPAERQPYQLQLTAPGGTRIVWVLTADNGR